jgi:hypothetical protein
MQNAHMFNIDPFMWTGLKAFFIPAVLGCLSYFIATVMARPISSSPRQFYISRFLILVAFVFVIAGVCAPSFIFSGDLNRYLLVRVRNEGAEYGILTLPIWLIIALLKRPKSEL